MKVCKISLLNCGCEEACHRPPIAARLAVIHDGFSYKYFCRRHVHKIFEGEDWRGTNIRTDHLHRNMVKAIAWRRHLESQKSM